MLSCTVVGPDYQPYAMNAPDVWTYSITEDQGKKHTSYQRWWQQYHDETLNRLVQEARTRNPNLKRAQSRISTAWYQRGVLKAAYYPKTAFLARDEHGMGSFSARDGLKVDPFSGQQTLVQQNFGWDIDLFGQNKRIVEAQTAEYHAKIEGWRESMVFISSEVASLYIALCTLHQRLDTAQIATTTYKQIYELIQKRHKLGIAAGIEVSESLGRYKAQQSLIPLIEREIGLTKNHLASLVGIYPKQLETLLASSHYEIPSPPRQIQTGIPVDILRSRPDIRRAERKIAAQTARIGIATAELYPKLSLSGAISYRYIMTGGITELLQRVYGLGPKLTWNIWNACKDRYRIEENKSILEEVIQTYEGIVINAVRQIEDSLIKVDKEHERLKLLQEASAAQKLTAEQMIEAYKTGLVDVRRLLNAQQDYFFIKDETYATQGRTGAFSAQLFRALGGGELSVPKEYLKRASLPQRREAKHESEHIERTLNKDSNHKTSRTSLVGKWFRSSRDQKE